MSEEVKQEDLSFEDLVDIYDTRMLEIARNANDIMKRRLSGEVVDKSETENQELLMKDLLRMEKAIGQLRKVRKAKGIDEPVDGTGNDSDSGERVLGRVKEMKSSIAVIAQKII